MAEFRIDELFGLFAFNSEWLHALTEVLEVIENERGSFVVSFTLFALEVFGTIHSTKISARMFENFLVSNGSRRVRTVSFHSTHKSSFALI